jgi:hypothetical protein
MALGTPVALACAVIIPAHLVPGERETTFMRSASSQPLLRFDMMFKQPHPQLLW